MLTHLTPSIDERSQEAAIAAVDPSALATLIALIALVAIVALALPGQAQAQDVNEDSIVAAPNAAIGAGATDLVAETPILNVARSEELTLRTELSKITEATKSPAKRSWLVELYSLTFVSAESYKNKSGAPFAYNYVGGKWIFAESQSVSLRQQFFSLYEVGADGINGRNSVSDLLVQYANSKLAEYGATGATTVSGYVKMELPTGETSRFITKTKGALYTGGTVNHSSGSFDLSFNVDTAWFNQSQNTHTVTEETGETKTIQHASWSYSAYVELDWAATKKLTLAQTIGTENVFLRGDATASPGSRHYYSSSTLLTYEPVSGYSFGGGFANKVDIGHPTEAFQIMRDTEVTYLVQLSAKI